MSKKLTRVTSTRRGAPSSTSGSGGAYTGTALVPVEAHAKALVLPTGGDAAEPFIQREGDVTLVVGQLYPMRGITIRASEVYYVGDLRDRRSDGPSLDEADKVAWRDPATGYECIMMRDRDGGFLSGYVGVPADHPFYGSDFEALTSDLGIEVHGGLNYSQICEDGPTPERHIIYESRRICHVAVGAVPLRHGSDYRVSDHAWWFGFSCDHIYDVIPMKPAQRGRFLSAETGAVYRDDAYVCNEIQNLAAQLKAIADGLPMPKRRGDPLPPRALDPTETD